jgi:hypothetical protein
LGTVAVNSGRGEAVIAASSEGATTEELTEEDEMPAEEAVSFEESFEMVKHVMAKTGKATKVALETASQLTKTAHFTHRTRRRFFINSPA